MAWIKFVGSGHTCSPPELYICGTGSIWECDVCHIKWIVTHNPLTREKAWFVYNVAKKDKRRDRWEK